jgi:hypothetical protein
MTRTALIVAATFVWGHAGLAAAQFVRGNEAVRLGTVELPPLPASSGKPCRADGKCHAGAWHMVETPAGLAECTEPYARLGTCRRSTYGTEKLSRLWIVKKGATWQWCQYPDLDSKCVDIYARPPANLPYSAVQ